MSVSFSSSIKWPHFEIPKGSLVNSLGFMASYAYDILQGGLFVYMQLEWEDEGS
jgi:hypothetical protein